VNLRHIFLLIVIGAFSNLYGQTDLVDLSTVESAALQSVTDLYTKTMSRNSGLYVGREYVDHYRGVRGHQFYESGDWEEGSICLMDSWYHEIEMKYDISSDEVIIGHFSEDGFFSPIRLIKDKVSEFELLDDRFIRLAPTDSGNTGLSGGFYKVLHEGIASAYSKYIKRSESRVSSTDRYYEFELKVKYYVIKENQTYLIGKKKSLLKVFYDREKEIKNYLKKNNYRLKDNKELELQKTVAYYNSIYKIDQ
jgi:hypothetical protein